MIIEEGKHYKTRGGAVRGPARPDDTLNRRYSWNVGGYMYQPDGMFYGDQEHGFDLVEELPSAFDPTVVVDGGYGAAPEVSPTELLADLHVQEQETKAVPWKTTKAGLLDAAKAAVADRGLNYGKPEDNFQRIAHLWNAHLENRDMFVGDERGHFPSLTAADVAQMMALMKIARLENDPSHLDSWTDLAGYAACGAEISA